MAGKPRDTGKQPNASKEERASPLEGNTTATGGYAEKHGPRFDADGWGEANAAHSDRSGTSEDGSQGQAAGERSFGEGGYDAASAEAAGDAALREPGGRGAADAQSPAQAAQEGSLDDSGPESVPGPLSTDGRQRDYGQGGGQGYVNSGKPGAPDPDPDSTGS